MTVFARVVTRREVEAQRAKAAKEARRCSELKKEVKLRKHTLVQVKAFLDETRPQQQGVAFGAYCCVWRRRWNRPYPGCAVVCGLMSYRLWQSGFVLTACSWAQVS